MQNEPKPLVISFDQFDAWYLKTIHANHWSAGYDLREWLVGISLNSSMFQLNILCFWIQLDWRWRDA